jgi:hypothetical protein
LNKQNHNLNKHVQKMIAAIYILQQLRQLSLLNTYKAGLRPAVIHADAAARSKSASEAAGWVTDPLKKFIIVLRRMSAFGA